MRGSLPLSAALTLFFAGVLSFSGRPARGQQEPSYVGASTCGICHPAQLAVQSASAHAQALSPAGQHRLADAFVFPEELIRPPRYHYRFRREGGGLSVKVSDPKEAIDIPLEWAFGAGEQAVTFVSQWDEDWYLEHYFSYYSATQSMGPTPGHVGLPSNTLPLAMGLMYRTVAPTSGIVQCFQCHSTAAPVISSENIVRPGELGVRCEACHGPGEQHVEAAASGDRERTPSLIHNPKRLPASELNQFCGRCHRAPVGGPVLDLSKAWNVRHQPIYLAKSACFLESKGTMSCLSCHDPHAKLDRNLSHYEARCAQCHGTQTHPTAAGFVSGQTTGCVGCHMPRVTAQDNLEFTNHWIGIYGEDKVQPRARAAR